MTFIGDMCLHIKRNIIVETIFISKCILCLGIGADEINTGHF